MNFILDVLSASWHLLRDASVYILFGLVVDQIYSRMGISAQAMVGQASEVMPLWVRWAAAFLVLVLSLRPLCRMLTSINIRFRRAAATTPKNFAAAAPDSENVLISTGCGPT